MTKVDQEGGGGEKKKMIPMSDRRRAHSSNRFEERDAGKRGEKESESRIGRET